MPKFRYLLVSCIMGVLATCLASADMISPSAKAELRPNDVDWTLARHYDITLGEFHFAPSRIVFRRGEPYALKLENRGRFRHTFTAPAFFQSVVFRPGGAMTEAEMSTGSLSLGAGEVAEIEFVPVREGTYALECTKPLHGLFGMSGDIIVQ